MYEPIFRTSVWSLLGSLLATDLPYASDPGHEGLRAPRHHAVEDSSKQTMRSRTWLGLCSSVRSALKVSV